MLSTFNTVYLIFASLACVGLTSNSLAFPSEAVKFSNCRHGSKLGSKQKNKAIVTRIQSGTVAVKICDLLRIEIYKSLCKMFYLSLSSTIEERDIVQIRIIQNFRSLIILTRCWLLNDASTTLSVSVRSQRNMNNQWQIVSVSDGVLSSENNSIVFHDKVFHRKYTLKFHIIRGRVDNASVPATASVCINYSVVTEETGVADTTEYYSPDAVFVVPAIGYYNVASPLFRWPNCIKNVR